MTWPVVWQDENGEELGRFDNPGFLSGFLPADDEPRTTVCLRFIDPYGDTVFNQLQLDQLLIELASLRPGITDLRVRRALDQLLAFLRRCAGQVHTLHQDCRGLSRSSELSHESLQLNFGVRQPPTRHGGLVRSHELRETALALVS
jgi:hypothetical protein